MYEEAVELLLSRDKDIQSDKEIFQTVLSDSFSPREEWDYLIQLRNGSIRFDACQEFLRSRLGAGHLEQAGDVRVLFLSDDHIRIELPGGTSCEQRVLVSISSVSQLINPPHKSASENHAERFLRNYLELLHKPNSIPDRVRLRLPSVCRNWSNFACWAYYLFALYPQDLIKGRNKKEYWENQLKEQQALRTERELSEKKNWSNQRLIANNFKNHMYRQLLEFNMPIFLQVPYRAAIPMEEFFSIAGC